MILYGAQTADGEDFPVLHRARGWRFDAYGVGNDHDVRSRPSLTRERSNVPAGNDQRMRLTVKQWPQVLTGGTAARARKGLGYLLDDDGDARDRKSGVWGTEVSER